MSPLSRSSLLPIHTDAHTARRQSTQNLPDQCLAAPSMMRLPSGAEPSRLVRARLQQGAHAHFQHAGTVPCVPLSLPKSKWSIHSTVRHARQRNGFWRNALLQLFVGLWLIRRARHDLWFFLSTWPSKKPRQRQYTQCFAMSYMRVFATKETPFLALIRAHR